MSTGGFERQMFKDGERLMILSNCQICGEARIGSSYDGSLQEWESEHTWASCAARSASAQLLSGQRIASPNKIKPHKIADFMRGVQSFRSGK
jgi:hypothetical protein